MKLNETRMNQPDIEIRTAPIREVRVATNPDGGHSVSGYAIVFNSPSVDLGGFTETVQRSALNRTLSDSPDVLCLRDHKQELLLGRTKSGTLTLNTDDSGLRFNCTLPNTTTGNDLAESLRRGDIDSCSFGFSVASDTWTTDGKGNDKRALNDIDLFEISIVSFPAYEATSASIRSAPVEIRSRIEAKRNKTVVEEAVASTPEERTEPAKETPDDESVDCACPCPECVNGDCADCSDDDCDCDGCDCDGDEERARVRFQKRSELTLRILEMTSTKQ